MVIHQKLTLLSTGTGMTAVGARHLHSALTHPNGPKAIEYLELTRTHISIQFQQHPHSHVNRLRESN